MYVSRIPCRGRGCGQPGAQRVGAAISVGAVGHGLRMPNTRPLRGTELRYALTMTLMRDGNQTIFDLIESLEYQGFSIPGYAPKAVSDALRWEMRKDRVRRLRRGYYGRGQMPRSTESYIHNRYLTLREEADALSGRDDDAYWDALFGKADSDS